MNNISSTTDCYGCGVCATICPHHIISMELNKDGFYEPKIRNIEQCTQCGLCLSVCSFSDEELALDVQDVDYYAAWSKDNQVRRRCSSGGIGFEIGKHLISQGYKACGVCYNSKLNRAEHYIANTVDEYLPSIGSKYIQSYTLSGFGKLNRKDKFLVCGTPCQIDSIRRYIRKLRMEDHYVLIDFFCHGVPSMHLWKQYLHEVEKQIGKVSYVAWRDKQTGWHDSWSVCMGDAGENGEGNFRYASRLSQGDLFYKFFLGNYCLGKACYKDCKYKMASSAADIRIGDLWGIKYEKNQEGVSAVLALTEQGKNLVRDMQDSCYFEQLPSEVVMEGQMRKSPQLPSVRKIIIRQLAHGVPLVSISKVTLKLYNLSFLPKRVYKKLLKIVKWEK